MKQILYRVKTFWTNGNTALPSLNIIHFSGFEESLKLALQTLWLTISVAFNWMSQCDGGIKVDGKKNGNY